ncbi:LPS translocon maturation chaperone LptM [Gluconobacter sp. P5E12]|uniref:Lipoprotein n=1 Tax=Gluconobacter cerinus TaxID=38307 RepID=A0A1B6VN81_9PROT|nr:hypothetical protein A0123_01246 [Gluconobacter cerinus]
MKRFLILSLTFLALSTSLSACGKKGAPRPPGPDSDVTYPRSYPAE